MKFKNSEVAQLMLTDVLSMPFEPGVPNAYFAAMYDSELSFYNISSALKDAFSVFFDACLKAVEEANFSNQMRGLFAYSQKVATASAPDIIQVLYRNRERNSKYPHDEAHDYFANESEQGYPLEHEIVESHCEDFVKSMRKHAFFKAKYWDVYDECPRDYVMGYFEANFRVLLCAFAVPDSENLTQIFRDTHLASFRDIRVHMETTYGTIK